MRLFTLVLVLLLAIACNQSPNHSGQSSSTKPHIVLIMADDLGFSDIGCYGSEIKTPVLDGLAKNGLRFSQFYNTAKCHSSRVSLLSGLYCDQAGGASLKRATTIAEVLSEAGYFTAMVGKWHLKQEPTDFGFQRYWGHLSGATNFFIGDNSFRLNGEKWEVPKTLDGRPYYNTDANAYFAEKFITEAEAKNKALFLYVAFNAPHYPLQAPEADVKKQKGNYDQGWDKLRKDRYQRQLKSGLIKKKWKLSPRPDHIKAWDSLSKKEKTWESSRMEVYAAMVEIVDQNVGRIVNKLKEKKMFDNTVFMFCSDNGACPFERTRGRFLTPWDPKGYWTYDASWAHMGNTPFRLYKQNQHQGGISSPMIVHWPNGLKTKAGSFTDQPSHIIDFMATCIDLSNGKYPKKVKDRIVDPLQGKSLLPIFNGQTRKEHDPLYFHFGTDRALRKGPWKLVSAKLSPWELFNMDEDRTELNDLSKKYPKRVASMSKEWFHIAKNVERLNGRNISPVKSEAKKLSFSIDTSVTGNWRIKAPSSKQLPKVLIIGDSISIGYTPFVKQLLKDKATVIHNKGNAQHTKTGLKKIDSWLKQEKKWDLIHFNWGLWDLCYRNPKSKTQGSRDKSKGTITTSLKDYENNLNKLVLRLKKTGAKLIWCSTSVVPEGEKGRFVKDAVKYNAVAAKVMKKHGITINDLHRLSSSFPEKIFVGKGNVHYKAEGSQKLAKQVVKVIKTALKK